MVRILLAFLFLSLPFGLKAQFYFNDNCKKAYSLIFDLRFSEAREFINQEKLENPGNLIIPLLENQIDFLTIIIGEEEEVYDSLKLLKNARISRVEGGNPGSPYYRYCLASINLQWAFARIKFSDYIRAAFEVNRAYHLIVENSELYPDFAPNLVGLGIFHSLIGTVPGKYQWVIKLFGFRGTIAQAKDEFTRAVEITRSSSYNFMFRETLFYTTFFQMNFKHDLDRSILYEEELDSLADDHILFSYAYGRILMKSGNNDKAIRVLSERPAGNDIFPFYYLELLLGKAKLNRLDRDADDHLKNYIRNFKGQNYIKEAYQKLAWYHLVNDDPEGYFVNMQKVIDFGDDLVDGDEQALLEARSRSLPNIHLLKARLFFDGGYYRQAESQLLDPEIDIVSRKDSVEYNYRLGRVYHAWDKPDRAIIHYKRTIAYGSEMPYYFAGNAALHLGMLYESRGEYANARIYYRICLDLDFEEYQVSIQQRAKAGLGRIQDKSGEI